ncbi:MAG: YdeI/OmpD-associated family protein [Nocardioidaceae bacterium]
MEFRATLRQNGKTATGIAVPADVVEALGGGKRPAVTVTLTPAGGAPYTYRTTVAPRGDEFLVPVSAAVRAAAGVAAGDDLDVDLALDTAPRTVDVPADLAEALAPHPEAVAFLEGLPPSHRKAYVVWVEEAKRSQTRATRVARAVEMLREGRRRS